MTENREPRRLLDDVYDGGAIKTCLEAGFWNFGTRTVKIEYDPGIDPDFGYQRVFVKPSDWCRSAVVSAHEFLSPPLLDYHFKDEGGFWFADIDTLFISMVSDGEDYGGNLGIWTESFSRYFEAYLASEIAWKLTRDKDTVAGIKEEMALRLKGAVSKDAMDSGTSVPPEGSWNSSRGRRFGFGRRDGGKRNQLLG